MYMPVAQRDIDGVRYQASFGGADKRFAVWEPGTGHGRSNLVVYRLGSDAWENVCVAVEGLEDSGWAATLQSSDDAVWLGLANVVAQSAGL